MNKSITASDISTHDQNNWHFAALVSELKENKAMLVRVQGKQIALFDSDSGVRACDNRCPHEGYPLSEGSLSSDCILTCNWHNWKFNLKNGDNLYGGDRLRTYHVDERNDEIWLDLTEPPYQERYDTIVKNLRDAFDDNSYDRIAREIARLARLGADPLDCLRLAIDWSWQRMEFGWTHAFAGMADWLTLYDENKDNEELQLVCLLESVAHCADDVLREQRYPYTDEIVTYNEQGFLNAIEHEDETKAIALIRGGLRDGLGFVELEPALTRAALAHYNDFGHALIYTTKAGELINHLGNSVTEPLLLSLVREMIFASREDKIPEFREYQTKLANWGQHSNTEPAAALWRKKSINKSMDATLVCSGAQPDNIYRELLLASAINLLSYDVDQQHKVHVSVSGNVGWLSFTHGLTFANAVRKQCSRFPELWPQGLLQMACFAGRDSAYTKKDYDVDTWCPDHPQTVVDEITQKLFDHDQDEYIASVHLIKTTLAVREEIKLLPEDDARTLVAGLNRFINSPLKRKQAHRTAYQSLQFVSKE